MLEMYHDANTGYTLKNGLSGIIFSDVTLIAALKSVGLIEHNEWDYVFVDGIEYPLRQFALGLTQRQLGAIFGHVKSLAL